MMKSVGLGQQPIPLPYQLPVPGQLYPIPELTMTKNQGGILFVAPPEKARWAVEVLQLGTVFHQDVPQSSEVVTGAAKAIPVGQYPTLSDWVDRLVLEGKVVLVFLHTVVKGPIRFVATSSPLLVAALAQPTSTERNYAVLDGPGYVIEKAQATLGKVGATPVASPEADAVNDLSVSKAVQEGSYSPAPSPIAEPEKDGEKSLSAGQQATIVGLAFLAAYHGTRAWKRRG